ncbi:MAG: tRNA-dihydrouridine synthase family protein [Verrucomicrobiae bacterium]|nr:tRNA-dihydrouridine synthase family protein [Verrucomicrobiae bacterium]
MSPVESFRALWRGGTPVLALAPMQDVTTLPFIRLLHQYGGADLYVTEYFRVHASSRPEKDILRCVDENPTGRPMLAQMIGNDIPALIRTAQALSRHPVAGIDLNLGCPAPVVYRKCAGGGLLREPQRVDLILGRLREAITLPLTVKTRLGFADAAEFETLLPIFARHGLDLLTVHGRTVADGYGGVVRYDLITQAATVMPCPVLANGNVFSPADAARVLQQTGARGVMLGRGAIRNPWLFRQIREHLAGRPVTFPRGREVLAYLHALDEATSTPNVSEACQVQALKKFSNQVGLGLPEAAAFLHDSRRAKTRAEFFAVCAAHLDHDHPLALVPAA